MNPSYRSKSNINAFSLLFGSKISILISMPAKIRVTFRDKCHKMTSLPPPHCSSRRKAKRVFRYNSTVIERACEFFWNIRTRFWLGIEDFVLRSLIDGAVYLVAMVSPYRIPS